MPYFSCNKKQTNLLLPDHILIILLHPLEKCGK